MGNINFNDGLKTYSINDDPNRLIKINPADFGILQRLDAAYKRLSEEYKELNNKEELTYEDMFSFSDKLKFELNYIFASDVADVVLAGASPMSTVNGEPLFQVFLNAILPIIEDAVREESAASEKRIQRYTEDLNDDRGTAENS